MNTAYPLENARSRTEVKNLEQLQSALNRYCLAITGSHWDAEDLVQETWLKALRTDIIFRHANPEAFLLRIAKNTWIDQSRRKNRLAQILQQERVEVIPADHGSFEIERTFQALMKHLSPLQRAVFLLRNVFGYSSAETARMLKTTEGAAKAALHRARHALLSVQDELEKEEVPLPEEEGLQVFLRALAAAYQTGDITRLVQLAQQDGVEPAMAIGLVQNEQLWHAHPIHQHTMQMAA
ncbi:RNA polymerase sigma factor [Aneurinibacillus sp. REN35]|uniref:RNA polymerase sigma factor n=1 Tax=Aneurinibacillus sp. REN35 TaxID=3237286 RepID=UPI003528892D